MDVSAEIHNLYVCFIVIVIIGWIIRLIFNLRGIWELSRHIDCNSLVSMEAPGERSVRRLVELHLRNVETSTQSILSTEIRTAYGSVEVPKSGTRLLTTPDAEASILRLMLDVTHHSVEVEIMFGLDNSVIQLDSLVGTRGSVPSIVFQESSRFLDVSGLPPTLPGELADLRGTHTPVGVVVRPRHQPPPQSTTSKTVDADTATSAVVPPVEFIILYAVDDVIRTEATDWSSGLPSPSDSFEPHHLVVQDSNTINPQSDDVEMRERRRPPNQQQCVDVLLIAKHVFVKCGADIFTLHDIYCESNECSICCAANASIILLPCRHHCLCEQCYKQVNRCPMCRSVIANVLEIKTSATTES
eukprot:PhF_6_TR11230/c0_g1_i1/m.18106